MEFKVINYWNKHNEEISVNITRMEFKAYGVFDIKKRICSVNITRMEFKEVPLNSKYLATWCKYNQNGI